MFKKFVFLIKYRLIISNLNDISIMEIVLEWKK